MDQGAALLIVLALMFFGALGAGCIPYWINVKESRLQTVSGLGGGLLLGSALAVVIPEGFHAFAEAARDAHEHHEGHGHDGPPPGFTGLALLGGFLAMLLLDQLQAAAGGGHCHPGHSHVHPPHLSDAEDASGPSVSGKDKAIKSGGASGGTSTGGSSAADRAIVGLLVHCAADGLALGSAFLSGNSALSFVVGVAMVLHKAPMAFGLTAYLQSCRWPWAKAQRTLLIFSATPPISTVITYTILRGVPLFTTPVAVSLAILFSGGTFLHAAAMHILPDVISSGGGHLSKENLVAVTIGCVLPVMLMWGHSH